VASTHGYAPVNGLKMYYETHGEGRPLVLLHGGAGVTDMFGEIMPILATGRKVIAAELQGHGRTADIDRPLRYDLMADDVAAMLRHLGVERADIMGYSLGGEVALRTAVRHPDAVRKLVLVSTAFRRDGWFPEVRQQMVENSPEKTEALKQSPMYKAYSEVASRLEDWPVLMRKLSDLLAMEYDWAADVRALKMPVMLVFGDADSVSASHAAEFFGLLGGGKRDAGWDGSGMSQSRLAVLPGTTHFTVFSSPVMASAVVDFLDAQR
jgi:pimeloyl-ACP methyl ester carboxylesterase